MMSYVEMTLNYYNNNFEMFAESSIDADMSANCDQFLGLIPSGGYILDLGCGTGRDSRYFFQKGYRVLPIDGSSEMCRIATEICGIKAVQMRFDELKYNRQ